MFQEVRNRNRKYTYFNRESDSQHESIWELLTPERVASANPHAHDFNSSFFVPRPDQYREVIPGIVPIPPRSRWIYDGQRFISHNNPVVLQHRKADLDSLLHICERLLVLSRNGAVGGDLSGGLDTSIVIELLKHFHVKVLLIGMKNSRYEFRTESVIQKYYANGFENSLLLNYEEHFPFSNLLTTPVHQLPSASSLFYSRAMQAAIKYRENEINTVFNGNGIDALLCEFPLKDGDQRHPESWFIWMMDDNWLNEYVFSTYGINYVPAAASKFLVDLIWLMRSGEQEDLRKRWGRRFFKDFLPKELVSYTYKADFVGTYMDGLWNSMQEISKIFSVTHSITDRHEFSQSSLEALVDKLERNDDEQKKLINSRVSFANWVSGLAKAGFY